MTHFMRLQAYWAVVFLAVSLIRGLSALLEVMERFGLPRVENSGIRKLADTWRIRKEKPWEGFPRASEQDQVVWIHAASGEFEYAKPVIRELQAQEPQVKVLVTYFSPTYRRQVESFPGVTWAVPLPFDRPSVWSKFVDHFRPQALLISRTDVWPGMIDCLSRVKLPLLLFSSTFGPMTSRLRPPARELTLQALRLLEEIQVVDPADAQFLAELSEPGELKVQVTGDTRYDQVRARLASPKPLPPSWRQTRSWIIGSAWAEDLAVVGPAWAALGEHRPRLVIVPHEPTEAFCRQIVEQASTQWGARKVARASAIRDLPHEDLDVLVVDQVGFLAELYQDAWIATVGGSYRRSVHSVMEALAAGVFCVLGPFHRNNREALSFQKVFTKGDHPMAAVQVAVDQDSCRTQVQRLFRELQDHPAWRSGLIDEVESRSGATQAVLSWLKRIRTNQ